MKKITCEEIIIMQYVLCSSDIFSIINYQFLKPWRFREVIDLQDDEMHEPDTVPDIYGKAALITYLMITEKIFWEFNTSVSLLAGITLMRINGYKFCANKRNIILMINKILNQKWNAINCEKWFRRNFRKE